MKFVKMHGIGNDYIYVDGSREDLSGYDLGELSRVVSDRNFGIGGDGLILVLPSAQADFRMRIFNSDGSEAEMCGNGIRCFAKLVYEQGLTSKTELEIETGAGIIRPALTIEDGQVALVRVDLGQPRLKRAEIPMLGEPADQPVVGERFAVSGLELTITCVSMGNPHCVVFVDAVDNYDVRDIGPAIESHSAFPQRTNVEFCQVLDRRYLKLRVWERGAGETLACGTGASAATVAGVLNGLSERAVEVELLGGRLQLEWAENDHVFLSGPAEQSFEGEFDPETLLAAARAR